MSRGKIKTVMKVLWDQANTGNNVRTATVIQTDAHRCTCNATALQGRDCATRVPLSYTVVLCFTDLTKRLMQANLDLWQTHG